MSEGNERNLESVAPEAAENIESEAAKPEAPAEPEGAAEPEAKAEVKAAPARPDEDEEEDEEDEAPARRAKKGGKKKKKRARRSAVIPLAIALVVVLVIFGVLVGYGLGRVRSQRQEGALPQGEQPAEPGAEVAEAYDPFSEALTNVNQQALDALAGMDAPNNGEAAALMGEDAFFADGAAQGEQSAAEPVVVAEYGDGQQLTSDEVLETYNEELASYILSGYSEDEVAATLLDDVLRRMVGDRVLEQHAKEMGLYETADADRAQIEAAAKEEYEDYLQYYLSEVTGTGDMTQEQIEAEAAAALLEAEGVSYEGVLARTEQNWWKHKLYDAVTSSVTVDDATVQAAYDARLADQKESFTTYPGDFEFSQRNGELILYNLPGYRAVKVLQLGFDDAEAAMAVYALSDSMAFLSGEETDAATEQQRQAELDGYYAGPEARAKEALEKLRGGADMDEMILSIGQDVGMRDARQRAMGYYVSANSTLWPEEFVTAAMALANVGDYSEPVRTEDGVCILQYVGAVPEGEVPLADVQSELTAEVLKSARDAAYDAQTEAWVAVENPQYYPERMQ